ncbi:MAG: CDP-diacylglycerol--glycerol-3-phosphate 3-phosphatidyltransferase [Pseudomonadota bacterium]
MLKHIPNLLCVARIFLVLPLLMLMLEGEYFWAFVIFAVAGITDGLDGFLARRFNWRSQLGAILDPIADKFLMVSVFLVLAATDMVPVWLALLVIGRDLLIVTGVVCYRTLIGPVAADASMVSKFNTLVQLVFVLAVLANAGTGVPRELWVTFLGAIVAATTLVSGLDYVREGIVRVWANNDSGLEGKGEAT